ncbi:hypothetical protein FKW77_000399 [Venturia effusa]|uniref:REJ domain-containing protein n=1 Tax=Venturia effusa TaxID=50376 RepID=A0A517LA82_9PEZI|nr:hypothetical protein FKW77_000399 [Venturia effusa]
MQSFVLILAAAACVQAALQPRSWESISWPVHSWPTKTNSTSSTPSVKSWGYTHTSTATETTTSCTTSATTLNSTSISKATQTWPSENTSFKTWSAWTLSSKAWSYKTSPSKTLPTYSPAPSPPKPTIRSIWTYRNTTMTSTWRSHYSSPSPPIVVTTVSTSVPAAPQVTTPYTTVSTKSSTSRVGTSSTSSTTPVSSVSSSTPIGSSPSPSIASSHFGRKSHGRVDKAVAVLIFVAAAMTLM